jgi:hypothetical protein
MFVVVVLTLLYLFITFCFKVEQEANGGIILIVF